MKLVEVVWWDASSITTGWSPVADLVKKADEPNVVRTAGYLLAKTKRHVLIVMNQQSDTQLVADVTAIPLSCVRSIRGVQTARNVHRGRV